jgi:signal transduction histidine kinase/ligand-binding sensor domain-containing protein
VRFNRRHMWSRCAQAWGAALLFCAPLFGIDRDLKIAQLAHTAWTQKDGAPTHALSLAQTTDGFLWIANDTGLYRFDGLHFELYRPPAGQSVPKLSSDLLAAPDGGLWIAPFRGPVSLLKGGKITTYPLPVGSQEVTRHLARDQQGVIWRSSGQLGIWRLVDSRWERVPKEWDPPATAYLMRVDRSGILWVETKGHGISYLPNGAKKFQHLASFSGSAVELRTGTHLAVEDLGPISRIRPVEGGPVVREFNRKRTSFSEASLVDDQGSLWVGIQGRGVDRTQYPERANGRNIREMNDAADVFTQEDGLTDGFINDILQDREGNIWVATDGGLDRFRQTPLIPVKLPRGSEWFAFSARDAGGVWVTAYSGKDTFFEILGGKATPLLPLPNKVLSLYTDPDGTVYLAHYDGILRLVKNKIEGIHFDFKSADSYPNVITKDGVGRLITQFNGKGLNRLDNDHWTNINDLGMPKNVRTLITDSAGHVWGGFTDNVVAQLDGDKVTTFAAKDGVTVGDVTIVQPRNGSIWIGGEEGLARLDGRRFVAVKAADGSLLRDLKDLVATADDGIWLGDKRGVIHIEESEARRVEQNSAYRVKYRLFDSFDGLSSDLQGNYVRPSMIQGTDGCLWFGTIHGVVWLDPKRIPRRPLAPSPAILSVTANDHTYELPSLAEIRLPPHTVNLHFAYTAPSLTIPERVHFRYKLEGSDKDWRDAGTRRDAFYTNLGPGSYHFHVMASDSEGAWNKAEAVTGFIIQPALYQTHWFYALCVCAALGLLWELYSLRLRQMSARLSAQVQGRLEAQFAERERIARELHDTLLQGFQGLTLHFQAVMERIPEKEPARQEMKKALTYADAVLLEGRQRVRELRPEGNEIHELSRQIAAYGEELAKDRTIALNVAVVGSPQVLHPVVSDEIYRIAREALANAFRHSHASKIEVEITYDAESLSLRVRDDGAGIGPEVLAGGKEGHWGLLGMRERARHIGAQLNVLSNPGSGAEVDLTLPAKVAYVGILKKRRWHWFARNKSGGR